MPSLQFSNKTVALVASDILHLLINYVDELQKFPPNTPKKIVEVKSVTLQVKPDFDLLHRKLHLFPAFFRSLLQPSLTFFPSQSPPLMSWTRGYVS